MAYTLTEKKAILLSVEKYKSPLVTPMEAMKIAFMKGDIDENQYKWVKISFMEFSFISMLHGNKIAREFEREEIIKDQLKATNTNAKYEGVDN